MHLVSLKLLNFRNYDRLTLNFSQNKNIIYGKNGMGKTNLVEAIYVLALTKSFRGSLDKILIKDGKNLTKISGLISDEINHDYQLIITNEGKNAKIDNNKQSKLSNYISKINVILFNPDNLRFIKDSPSIRRNYLNIDLSQLDNSYLTYLNQYNRIIKQRNAYLKTMYVNSNASIQYLEILTDKLIDYGLVLYEKRKKYISQINSLIGEMYSKISGINTLKIKYICDYEGKSKKKIKQIYLKNQDKDMILGKTSFGIHHDDMIFMFDDTLLKDYASEGQQKNAIISYKLSQIEIFKNTKNTLPILILDDLFSELDSEKIDNILKLIDDEIQTFITTTEIDNLSLDIKNKSKIFHCLEDVLKEE